MHEILAEVYRNKTIESIHHGSIVVTDNKGTVLYYCGDPNLVTFSRSSAKAFQFLAVHESGAIKRFGHNLQQIAIMLGSHNGSDLHQQVAKSNLELIGLDESYLQCGTHTPVEYTLDGYVPYKGQTFSPLGHNCSGKHSGQLALSLQIGDDPRQYINPEARTQKLVKQTVSEAYDFPAEQFLMGTDGCSLPNFALPLKNMAMGYAKMITGDSPSAVRREAYKTVVDAARQHPEMVSGNGRFDLAATKAGEGDIVCKVGGEAVEVVGVISKGLGIAVKIADGNTRALYPVVLEVLRQLGVFNNGQLKSLEKFSRPPLYNYRKLNIGEIIPVFKLERG